MLCRPLFIATLAVIRILNAPEEHNSDKIFEFGQSILKKEGASDDSLDCYGSPQLLVKEFNFFFLTWS